LPLSHCLKKRGVSFLVRPSIRLNRATTREEHLAIARS